MLKNGVSSPSGRELLYEQGLVLFRYRIRAEKYCDKGDLLYSWSASFGPRIWDGEKADVPLPYLEGASPSQRWLKSDYLLHLLGWDVEQIKEAHGDRDDDDARRQRINGKPDRTGCPPCGTGQNSR